MSEGNNETPRYFKLFILFCKIVGVVLLIELILEFFKVI
jgi:hypothetical protein